MTYIEYMALFILPYASDCHLTTMWHHLRVRFLYCPIKYPVLNPNEGQKQSKIQEVKKLSEQKHGVLKKGYCGKIQEYQILLLLSFISITKHTQQGTPPKRTVCFEATPGSAQGLSLFLHSVIGNYSWKHMQCLGLNRV